MSTSVASSEYIDAITASKILDLPVWTVRRMARRGKLTVQRIPGTRPRLLRSEIERLAHESTVAAK